jgi:small subunit ribosomal protein S10
LKLSKILGIIRVPKIMLGGSYPVFRHPAIARLTSSFKGKKMEKIRLKLKAYDHRVLDRSVAAIVDAVKRTGAEIRGPIPMPTKIKRYTVLKSPHVNKDSREQFEIRVHGRMIDIVSATSDTVDSLMKLDLAPEIEVEIRSMDK